MKRRSFLRKTATVGAASAAGVFAILKYPRGARAAGWGAWPADRSELRLANPALKILEIQINGGLSPWDTFYTVPGWGEGDEGYWRYVHTYSPDAPAIDGQLNRDDRFGMCSFGGEPLWVDAGMADGDGNALSLGPWTVPWRGRADILDRMRVVVQRHDNVAHEGANPLSLTGDRLGQPRLAGLGTAIQRYFTENPDAADGMGGIRTTPYSYILYPGGAALTGNANSGSAVGFHPGSARPLDVSVEPGSPLNSLLSRGAIDDPERFDAAVTYYRQRYEARFRPSSIGAPTRSAERSNYEFADFARRNAPDLRAIFEDPTLFMNVTSAADCAGPPNAQDAPSMQARMAAALLTREVDPAHYVLWVDAGLVPAGAGAHDCHNFHTQVCSINTPHTLNALASIIGDGPGQINLDDTLIIVNTEFGRTPYRQAEGGGSGTNHWPWGYVTLFIGGPIATRGCYGRIGYMPGMPDGMSEDGYAIDFATPAENRIMALNAMGIYPFSSQSFAVGDVRGGVTDEEQAIARVRDTYLGLG